MFICWLIKHLSEAASSERKNICNGQLAACFSQQNELAETVTAAQSEPSVRTTVTDPEASVESYIFTKAAERACQGRPDDKSSGGGTARLSQLVGPRWRVD